MRKIRSSSRAASLLLGALASAPLAAQTPAAPMASAMIEASGSGEAKVTPDRAWVTIAVQNRARTAALAGQENAKVTAAVLEAIRRAGVAREQVSTSAYNVAPQYRYYPDGRKPELTGYEARNTVRVEIRALELLSKVIDSSLASGATNIGGVQFFASQLDATRRLALGNATSDARLNAEAMAKAAGGSLGPLMVLTSQNLTAPQEMDYAPRGVQMAMAKAADEPTPIVAPTEQTVAATVTGRWQFIPAIIPAPGIR